jgi:predicted extracellular nuclease
MPSPFRGNRTLVRLLSSLLLLISGVNAYAQSHVVISQVYGAGGNSGALYNRDYVELFNPTNAAVTIPANSWSVQYASAAGTSIASKFTIPNVTLQPGQFYLIGLDNNSGSTVGANPGWDSTGSIAMSASAGKVFLASTNTNITLSGGCPATGSAVVDWAGYGSTVNCSEGGTKFANLDATHAAVRKNVCVDTDSNGNDFQVASPNPHNFNSALQPCNGGGQTNPAATASANPNAVNQGSSTVLTVNVTPGTNPSSTGITVTADLSAFGGLASQAFSGSNNSYTFTLSVSSGQAPSAYTIPVTVTDAQSRTATTSISLTVQQAVQTMAIHDLQKNVQSLNGSSVTVQGIVTGVRSNGFFVQSRDQDADSDPTTSEGVFVFTSSTLPASAALGNFVEVTGTVSLYPTGSPLANTELGKPAVTFLSQNNPLPTPVQLTVADDNPNGALTQFMKYQSMRVSLPSITVSAPTMGSLNEPNATYTSNGLFFGVFTGVPRPFREPGIDIQYALPSGAGPNVAHFDSNPEVIEFDSKGLGRAPIDATTGVTISGISAIADFSYGNTQMDIEPTSVLSISPNAVAQAVPAAAATEFTIGDFNLQHFYNDKSGDGPATVLTTTAYQKRLNKASLTIRNILNMPDIVAIEENENQSTVNDLAAKINSDAVSAGQTNPQYLAYSSDPTNDISGITVGFLVKATRVNVLNVQQYGHDETITDTRNNPPTQGPLNDRPPLVLHAGLKRIGGSDFPVTVIAVHQRSLIGIEDTGVSGDFIRTKREAQAEYLANLVQSFQSKGERVVVLGDFNAFEFNDGYVDVLGTVEGNPAPADQVTVPSPANLVSPHLVDLSSLLPAAERWSYTFGGDAQEIDHILTTQDLVSGSHMSYAHVNADFPAIYYNDGTRPEHSSDHDAAVSYFTMPAVKPIVSFSNSALSFPTQIVNTSSAGQVINLTNTGDGDLTITNINTSGNFAQRNSCPANLAPAAQCSINIAFTPSIAGNRTGSLTITSNAGNGTVSLAGVGASFSVTSSGLVFNRVTKLYNGALSVKNTGPLAVQGPLQVILSGLPNGVSMTNANGTTNGIPYVNVSAPVAAGANVNVPIQFSDPSNAPITFSPTPHAGLLQ